MVFYTFYLTLMSISSPTQFSLTSSFVYLVHFDILIDKNLLQMYWEELGVLFFAFITHLKGIVRPCKTPEFQIDYSPNF
jgi:hypothetical protein